MSNNPKPRLFIKKQPIVKSINKEEKPLTKEQEQEQELMTNMRKVKYRTLRRKLV